MGDNNITPVYDSTYKVNKIASVATQANQLARKWSGQEGRMYPKGDPQALVEVALIGPETVIVGPIHDADIDADVTLLTSTSVSTNGTTGIVTNSCDFTPVGDLETMYCRTGANRGLYRITTNSATKTTVTNTVAWPYDVAIGDTFVRVPLRQGISYIYTDTLAMYIDSSLGLATNYYGVDVVDMDLTEAGSEKAWFRFLPSHFDGAASD